MKKRMHRRSSSLSVLMIFAESVSEPRRIFLLYPKELLRRR
ncbi:hypothetical protein HMPREF7215_2069 [Pyramidobacter piscolens W5455]|uniref:Uncharacterized protein n=1 Tax=Pyramidobacter piscolens W5455 TaxID=352165 RepID=A0ABP2HWY5_9BACT|nr:hypothetical protein HMPREF7215_2069 [Pyramidobacter piscolens W5455]